MKSFVKCLSALTLVIVVCANSFAQSYEIVGYEEKDSTTAVSPIVKPAEPTYSIDKPPGLRMRNTGRTLTIAGSVLFITGFIVYNNADESYYNTYNTPNGTYEEGDPQAAVGILMISGGAGMMVPGIIFWSKGAKKYKRHVERQSASIGYNGTAISLRYKF